MRVTQVIDASEDEIEKAKQTAVALAGDTFNQKIIDLFFIDNLQQIEAGIKKLNEYSNNAYILSSILLFTLIYNKSLYQQSGLTWAEYARQSRERLGIDNRDITEQLSSARFFIRYHEALKNKGFNLSGSNRKLARAELALRLCGDINEVLEHLVNDQWLDFKAWYQSLKPRKALPVPTENSRTDIRIEKDHYYIGNDEAISISDKIPESDRIRLNGYMKAIFKAIKEGYEPAIVPVYDKKEASIMPALRDKYRQGK